MINNTSILLKLTAFFILTMLITACATTRQVTGDLTEAEKLGFKKGRKVLILHADDAGMSPEANGGTIELLSGDYIQAAAVMAPCPNFEDFINWAKENPSVDVGMHLTLTSEWQTYRWGPVSKSSNVPSLIDPDGKLWHEVPDVVLHASAEEVEIEIRAQIEAAIALGWRPTHIDTHMGTLYGSPAYVAVFIKVAEEYGIPANILDLSHKEVVDAYKKVGYPINDEVIEMVAHYKLPKLDNFTSVPKGKTYEQVKNNFFQLVKSLKAGLTEIIFHPCTLSENLKTITNSWQQRVWETQLFSDPEVIQFFKNEGIVFTNWKELMERHQKHGNKKNH